MAKINLALKEHDGDTLAQLVAVRSLFVNDSDQESFMDRYADTIGESAGKKGSEETFYGKTVSLEGKYRRNQLRIAYLDHVIEALRSGKSVVVAGAGSSGQVGASHGSQVTEAGQPSGSARVPDAQKPLVPEPRAGRLTLLQNLNIRATPGIEGQKLGVLTKGTTVPFVTRVAGGWYQIDYNGAAAFLSGSSKYVHVQTDSKDDVSNTRKLSEKGKQDDKGGASTLQHLYCAIGHMVDEVTESFADLYAGDTDSLMRSNDTSLGMLLSQDRLTPDQIAQARQEIAKLPPAERARYYLQLQSKPEYQNQRDNSTPKEKASRGGTCNLTSVAMCLEYLGVANPYPTLQYDDALIKLAEEQGWTDLTEHRTWRMVAKKLGVDMEAIQSAGENAPRSFWESTVRDQHLSAGHSVLCSLNGHIVRVQEVTDSGLVVDDPYGASRLTASHYKFEKKNKGRDAGKEWNPTNKTNEGEDHAWSWPEIESHTFGIIYAFSR